MCEQVNIVTNMFSISTIQVHDAVYEYFECFLLIQGSLESLKNQGLKGFEKRQTVESACIHKFRVLYFRICNYLTLVIRLHVTVCMCLSALEDS